MELAIGSTKSQRKNNGSHFFKNIYTILNHQNDSNYF